MLDHDSERQVVHVVDALAHTTSLAYDLAGQLAAITDPGGDTTTFTRDAQERVLATQYADGTSQSITYGEFVLPSLDVSQLSNVTIRIIP
ncbi:MAG: RHS repeat protein [Myxococcales bacterium]|nr:RHS repeat protein [Myxococcales bacterium]